MASVSGAFNGIASDELRAALPQFFFNQRKVGTDEGQIEHIQTILSCRRTALAFEGLNTLL